MRLITALLLALGVGALVPLQAEAQQPDEPPAHDQAAAGEDQPPAEVAAPDLMRLVAPVALYPDPVLSLVLMASTYTEDVLEAARWSRQSGLRGEAAVRSALRQPWDISVQVLVAFPSLIAQLADSPDWMRQLGRAYLASEPDMLSSVQALRQRAYAAGQLRSSEQMYVERRGANIVLQSASASTVHVPVYSAAEIFGPAAEPSPAASPSRRGGALSWAPGVPFSRGFVFAGFDWPARHAHVASLRLAAPIPNAAPVLRAREETVTPAPPVEGGGATPPGRGAVQPVPPAAAPAVPLVSLIPGPSPRSEPPVQTAPKPAAVVRGETAAPEREPANAQPGMIRLLPESLDPGPATLDTSAPPLRAAAAVAVQAVAEPASAAMPSAAAGSSAPTAPVKPRFRAFVSDADRRTLDGLLGASGRR